MTDMTDMSQFKDLYVSTARELVVSLTSDLEKLRQNRQDVESIKSLHINSHSLKGQSYAMNFQTTAHLGGSMEYLFRNVLDGKLQLSDEIIFAIAAAIKKTGESIDHIAASSQELDLTTVYQHFEQVSGVVFERKQ